MAQRSLLLYVKLFLISCCQMGIQFSYSSIFGLAGPLFGKEFGMPSAGVNIIFSFVGPMIGFFVQPIFGAIGDKCTFKFGRRRIFLVIGAIVDIIGLVIIALSTFVDRAMSDDNSVSESTESAGDHIVGILFALVGLFIAFFGTNLMQGPSRAIVSDIVDVENQQDCNLMINACSGIASVVCYTMSAFTIESDNAFLIMFGLCAAVVCVSTIPTVIFAKEEQFKLGEGEKLNIAQPFIDLFHAIKMINLNIFFILLSLMLGWFAFQPFNTNFSNYFGKDLYGVDANGVDHTNEGTKMGLLILAVFAAFQCLSVFFFPVISGTIGEVTTFLVSQALGGVSYAMLCALTYTFPENPDDHNSDYYSSVVLGFVCAIFPAMAFVQTNSLPYSLLKKVVPESRFGAFVGLLNCAVVIAQFLASGLTAVIQIFSDKYLIAIIISAVSSFFAALGSIVLYKVERDSKKGQPQDNGEGKNLLGDEE